MTSRRTWLAAVSLAALVGNAAWAAAGSDALRRFVEETRSASGRFTQRLTDRKGEALDAPAEGTFCFRRPGLFAWRTETPFVQEIVSDGKVVKLWDRRLRPFYPGTRRHLTFFSLRNPRGARPEPSRPSRPCPKKTTRHFRKSPSVLMQGAHRSLWCSRIISER